MYYTLTPIPQQVDEWYPELIEVEERAKDSASLLFFVIDSQTRAVSSMVEIAFFAGELVLYRIAGIFAMRQLNYVHVCDIVS